MTFAVGQKVRLKSGSPTMTVEGANEEIVACVWFDGKQNLKRDQFVPAVLEEHEPHGDFKDF